MEATALAEDLRSFMNVLCATNGIFNQAEEVGLTARYAKNAAVTAKSHSNLLDRFSLTCVALLHSSAKEVQSALVARVLKDTDTESIMPGNVAEFVVLCKQLHRACSQRHHQHQQASVFDCSFSLLYSI